MDTPIDNTNVKKKKGKKVLTFFIILLCIIIGVCAFFLRIKKIPAGYVAVINRLKTDDVSSTKPVLQNSGLIYYIRFYEDIELYPTSVQNAMYDNMKIYTKDGVEFTVKPRVSYQLDTLQTLKFAFTFNQSLSDISKGFLKELVANAFVINAATFSSDSLVENHNVFENNVKTLLSSKMQENGFSLKNINSNLQIPFRIKEVIELRNEARRNTMLAQARLKEEYAKANIQRVKDSLIYSSLTDLAIRKLFIDKWDGRLSTESSEPKIYKEISKEVITDKK